jgi:hypothetical protein
LVLETVFVQTAHPSYLEAVLLLFMLVRASRIFPTQVPVIEQVAEVL